MSAAPFLVKVLHHLIVTNTSLPGAVKEVFGNDVRVLLCDFHRKQAWWRWVSAKENGVPATAKHDVFEALERIATAPTDAVFWQRVAALSSDSSLSSLPFMEAVQTYLRREWLPYKEMWARCDRMLFHGDVHTNNYTESMNRTLKYQFLPLAVDRRVDSLLRLFKETIMPHFDREYLRAQYAASNPSVRLEKQYPQVLTSIARPPRVLKHLQQRLIDSQSITAAATEKQDYTVQGGVVYLEKSHTTLKSQYDAAIEGKELAATVTFGQYKSMLSTADLALCYRVDVLNGECSCEDWRQRQLVCKHLFAALALTGKDFSSLPRHVREAVHITVDTAVVDCASGPSPSVSTCSQDDGGDQQCKEGSSRPLWMEDVDEEEETQRELENLIPHVQGSNACHRQPPNVSRPYILGEWRYLTSLLHQATPQGWQALLPLLPQVEAALLRGTDCISGGQHGGASSTLQSDRRALGTPNDCGVADFRVQRQRGRPPVKNKPAQWNANKRPADMPPAQTSRAAGKKKPRRAPEREPTN